MGIDYRPEGQERHDSRYAGSSLGLSPRAKRAVRMHVSGMANIDIAQILGMAPGTVSRNINSEAGKAYIDELSGTQDSLFIEKLVKEESAVTNAERVRQILEEESVPTINKLLELRDSTDEKVALSAANSLLDRAGHKAKDAVEVGGKLEASPELLGAIALLRELNGKSEELKDVG